MTAQKIPHMRTIPGAVKELKGIDPNFPITVEALTRWVREGRIPHVSVGRYRYVSLENLIRYLNGGPEQEKEDAGRPPLHS